MVAYSGLTPSETYKVSGILMDKATGEPLLVGEDQAQVTAEVEFTPESADGTVELTYTLDASTLAGTTIVVFETLYQDDVEIAAHADINDENQTVESLRSPPWVPPPLWMASTPQTPQAKSPLWMWWSTPV